MNRKQITTASLAALIAAGVLAGTVSAQSVAAATGITLEQAAEIALAEVPGTVQEVELETEDGIQVFEVEILTADGAEMEVEIAAATGEILEVEAEDSQDDEDDEDEDDGADDDA